MSYPDILLLDWSQIPFDIIASIALYLSARDILNLCIRNDSFNRRVCATSSTGDYGTQNQDSIIWKLLYQRDISEKVPRNHIASRYLDIMDRILTFTPKQLLFHGADYGYEEIVKYALKQGIDIHSWYDYALHIAAKNGHTEIVKLLLDKSSCRDSRRANIHAGNDLALRWAAMNGRTETVKLLLDRGAYIHTWDNEALRLAVNYGHTETAKLLLKRETIITQE